MRAVVSATPTRRRAEWRVSWGFAPGELVRLTRLPYCSQDQGAKDEAHRPLLSSEVVALRRLRGGGATDTWLRPFFLER